MFHKFSQGNLFHGLLLSTVLATLAFPGPYEPQNKEPFETILHMRHTNGRLKSLSECSSLQLEKRRLCSFYWQSPSPKHCLLTTLGSPVVYLALSLPVLLSGAFLDSIHVTFRLKFEFVYFTQFSVKAFPQ